MNTDKPGSGSAAKPFHCTTCPKTFVYEKSLQEHILNKHVEDKQFQCTECFKTKQLTKSFATQTILTKHLKRVHGPPRFKCTVCFKTFSDASNFASHKRSHSKEKRYKCNICSKAFYFNHVLLNHLFIVHKQKRKDVSYFKCEICSLEFAGRSVLESHVVQEHVADKAFECLVCSKTFIDQQTLEKHRKCHDRQHKHFCDVCSQGFRHTNSLIRHLGVKHNYFFYCYKCWRSFKNKPDFDAHISDSKQELKCYICQELINSECNLKIHTNSHVKEIKTKTKDNIIENKIEPLEADTKFTPTSIKELNSKNFYCPLCSKTFDREAYFTAHRREVHPNAEWKCDVEGCPKTYKVYSQFRLHKMMHAETKEFVCNICQKSFYRPDSLKDHKQVHLREKKFKCEICPKSFLTPGALRIHIANNHGGPKPFNCSVLNCGTLWASNYQLKVHLISHQTEKSFKCEICQQLKAFKTLRQLEHHQRQVHNWDAKKNKALTTQKIQKNWKLSDAVVFMCSSSACSFETRDEKDVALHYNKHHQLPKVLVMGNSSSLTLSPFVPRKFETIRMIQKRYNCRICQKYFQYSSSFYEHRKRFHPDQVASFKCHHCPKLFKYINNINLHIRQTHSKLNCQ